MAWYFYVLIIVGVIIFLTLIACYIIFKMTFYSKNRKLVNQKNLLPNQIYNQYHDIIVKDIEDVRALPYQELSVISFDGLILKGKYYEQKKGNPIEIMFHGYKGNGERDLSTGIKRAFLCNHNALIVDQRASGASEGHIITFGINERHDCLTWVNHIIEVFGKDVEIIITGISMGASTVLMASALDLPKNVIGVIADCGFNKASDIIKEVIRGMKLPANLLYPLVRLSARIFGKFNLEETSPYEAVQKSKIPIIFFHGGKDNFVPCHMSEKLFDACSSPKKLVKIDDAAHGVSYLAAPEKYLKELESFFNK